VGVDKVIGKTEEGNQVETLDAVVIAVVAILEEIEEEDKEGTKIGEIGQIEEMIEVDIEEVEIEEGTIGITGEEVGRTVEIEVEIETTTEIKTIGPMVTGKQQSLAHINHILISACFFGKDKILSPTI
jgi:hypothetical protein